MFEKPVKIEHDN